MRTWRLLFAYILVLLTISMATIDSTSPLPESWLVTIRVDEDCRIWWNIRRESPDNLPQLLPPDSLNTTSADYDLDFNALFDLVTNLVQQERKRMILLTIHPNSHYVCTDNVLAVLDMVEDEYNELAARQLNKSVDSLVGRERFTLRYAIGSWYERDGKVMAATHAARGFVDSLESIVPEKLTFEFQLQAGHWSDREDMIEMVPPVSTTPPKMGKQRPVRDEDSLKVSPLLKYVKP